MLETPETVDMTEIFFTEDGPLLEGPNGEELQRNMAQLLVAQGISPGVWISATKDQKEDAAAVVLLDAKRHALKRSIFYLVLIIGFMLAIPGQLKVIACGLVALKAGTDLAGVISTKRMLNYLLNLAPDAYLVKTEESVSS